MVVSSICEGEREAVKWNASVATAIRVLSARLFLVFIVVCDWNILSIEALCPGKEKWNDKVIN